MKKGYSKKELTALGKQRTFSGRSLDQVVFPIGGIGTGSVGLNGRGGFQDWEIFNRPNFDSFLYNTFPIVWAREKGKDPVTRILMSPTLPPHVRQGGGNPHLDGGGFPHMDGCTFTGEYPFAHVDFESKKLPVEVELEAYNPFIPGNEDESGFPAAILKYSVTNPTKQSVNVTVAWSLQNAVGSIGNAENDKVLGQVEYGLGQNVNEYLEQDGIRGLHFTSNKWHADHPRFGSMALTTPDKNVTVCRYWSREGWFAPRHELWDTFSATGKLPDHDYGPGAEGQAATGALGVRLSLKPSQTKTVTFYVSWYFPNFEKYWHDVKTCVGQTCSDATATVEPKPTWKNYYAKQFDSAFDVALKLNANEKRLYQETKAFHDALFGSTLPPHVLDAISSQMAILKTATVLRLDDGTFYGFEGCAPVGGCCEGSCTHVWNYQQALPFLFPALERSMRSADYRYNMRDDGGMCFRLQLPLGVDPDQFHACADGQMGGIIKVYRDWKLCGDNAWLKTLWPQVKRALEFAWMQWDPDRDGVMDGIQHNTYDIEFLGPNPMMACFYLGALKAASEMAEYLGEPEKAAEYLAIYEQGRKWIDENLYNGEFYIQQYDPKDAPIHQFGTGCLADQVLGQWVASLSGLGHVLDPKHVKQTLKSIFKYNWLEDLSEHANAQRVYALNDEAGLLLCSWPHGGRPDVPFVYSDEVWTGIEYQVASHCIMEGLLREGLAIVKGVRDRHDGIARNPWDEFECGHHYARAMASYGLLTALSGFQFDMVNRSLKFDPQVHEENFRCFWALEGAWGTYEQNDKKAELKVLSGSLKLKQITLTSLARADKVAVFEGGKRVKCDATKDGGITLTRAASLRPGRSLKVTAK